MKVLYFLSLILTIFFVNIFFMASTSYAISFDLIAPTGQLSRGQEVQFIVNLDTEGTSVTNQVVGMTYQSQYLQYVSTAPGDAMNSVTVTNVDDSTLVFTGTNSSGFNGNGAFAYVTFKIIAPAPGTAELCALFQPSVTPSPVPTSVVPTTPETPLPTQLPVTGTVENTLPVGVVGAVLVLSSATTALALKRYSHPDAHRTHKKR
jgi:hypothetical protein